MRLRCQKYIISVIMEKDLYTEEEFVMANRRGACLICGKPLIYNDTAREMECSI